MATRTLVGRRHARHHAAAPRRRRTGHRDRPPTPVNRSLRTLSRENTMSCAPDAGPPPPRQAMRIRHPTARTREVPHTEAFSPRRRRWSEVGHGVDEHHPVLSSQAEAEANAPSPSRPGRNQSFGRGRRTPAHRQRMGLFWRSAPSPAQTRFMDTPPGVVGGDVVLVGPEVRLDALAAVGGTRRVRQWSRLGISSGVTIRINLADRNGCHATPSCTLRGCPRSSSIVAWATGTRRASATGQRAVRVYGRDIPSRRAVADGDVRSVQRMKSTSG